MLAPVQVSNATLRNIGALSGLPDSVLDWLLQVGSVNHLPRRKTLSSLPPEPRERYYFVLEGALAITERHRRRGSSGAVPALGAAPQSDLEYIGYLERGACFSDAFLAVQQADSATQIDCVATQSATLLQVETPHLASLLAQHPEWRITFTQRLRAQRSHFLAQQTPSRRVVQDFFLRENYSTSSVVRVTVRDHCMSCDKCFEACTARHGVPRMIRVGSSLGRLTFPVVCRNCHDKPCLAACRIGALIADGAEGEVRILDKCTGCGLCAKACPNGAITIVERHQEPGESSTARLAPPTATTAATDHGAAPSPAESGKKKRRRAVKCDNCAGYDDRACLTACPTGALMEILPEKLFLETEVEPSTLSHLFSDGAFLAGAPSLRQRPFWTRYNLFITLLVLALAGTGVEAFLRATQPELSLTGHFVRWAQLDWVVTYSSGRGFGHWLGYLGTVAMLLSVLYSLRTRVRRFSNIGKQTTWLSAHLWLGFIGGTLVTYHSALKLDRWASIACILIWLVLVTGALGRYLYGALHAGAGLAEFELRVLRARIERWSPPTERTPALRMLLEDLPPQGQRARSLVVVLWHELRDPLLLLSLRFRRLPSFGTREERRAFLESVACWAANRRLASYCTRAEVMLRHWNIVHIVLAIVMFAIAAVHIVYGFVYKVV